MKILTLHLIAYGPFTDALLDLSGGNQGLHLIYGPNEAGKSSALRALRNLLYGIPERSADDFRHPYAKMRIGASIRAKDGSVLALIRRKGRGGTLRAADDAALVEESELQRFLPGVDSDLFSTMFGIGHEDLVRGGREIIQGGGDLGRLLFAAGSGIAGLREVQAELQAEADLLFRPSGQKQKINEALGRLGRSRKELREVELPGAQWVRHDEALRQALQRKESVEGDLARRHRELNRLQRIRDAFPLIAGRGELLREMEEYAGAVLLPADFPEKRRDLVSRLQIAHRQKEQAIEAMQALQKAVSESEVSSVMMNHAEAIEEIHRELGSLHKAARDRVQLETRRSVLMGDAKEILRNLREDLTLEEAERLRIRKPEAVRIQELGSRYGQVVTRIQDAREKIPEISRKISEGERNLDSLDPPRPVEALRQALDEAEAYGPLEKPARAEEAEIAAAARSLDREKGRLGLSDRTDEDLERLPVPSSESIRAFEDRFTEADRRLADLEGGMRKLEDTRREVERRIEAHRMEREVPTEADLETARELRDSGWGLISRRLDGELLSEEEVGSYLKQAPDSDTLSRAFETALRKADTIADRLRREAGSVAEKARLLADRSACMEDLRRFSTELDAAGREKTAVMEAWNGIWNPLGIPPRSAREMARWEREYRSFMEKTAQLRMRRAKADDLKGTIDEHRRKLAGCLSSLPGAPDDAGESLTVLIKRARGILDREEALWRRREQMSREKALQEEELEKARAALKANEKELESWQMLWEDAVRPLGLDAQALPAEASAVMEELKDLFDKLKEAGVLLKRIEGIDRDAAEFGNKIAGLAQAAAVDPAGRSAGEIAIDLHNRLKQSRDALTQKQTLEKQLDAEKVRLDQAGAEITKVETELAVMCEEARCTGHQDLQEAERRSNRRREIEAALKGLDERLRGLSAGRTVEDFVREAMAVDPDGIDSAIGHLEEEMGGCSREKSELDQAIGSERTELGKMDGSSRAVALAEEIQLLLGGIEHDAERYARLRIAARVLHLAVERYREKSQGPILTRASSLFAGITGGSFQGIRAEFDGNGQPVLMGMRPAGEMVSVQGMSEGTADQLYLALRLAGLEEYLGKNEPIPFIVDDILIKFDDSRAAATLSALAELSRKTQVIFFTHHRHLVELARQHVNESVLIEHSLA